MALGPGRYDDLCTYVRLKAKALGAVVIVLDGELGMGFSVQAPPLALLGLASVLEHIAKTIRESEVENDIRAAVEAAWNLCPKCGKEWPDKEGTPQVLHRTKLCDECKK